MLSSISTQKTVEIYGFSNKFFPDISSIAFKKIEIIVFDMTFCNFAAKIVEKFV